MSKYPIMDWILEYEQVSSQRQGSHELNNYLTPLAMQISMLKKHLADENLEKATLRIEKLERAAGKLKDYSKRNLVKMEQIDAPNLTLTKNGIEELILGLTSTMGCPPPGLIVSGLDIEFSHPINAKLFTLLLSHILRGCNTESKLHIGLEIENYFPTVLVKLTHTKLSLEDLAAVRVALERFRKIHNASSDGWQVQLTSLEAEDISIALIYS